MQPGGFRITFAGTLLALWLAWPLAAVPAPTLEYQVKASYLFNFARFVTWPGDVFGGDRFNLCVIGADRFGGALDALKGERVDGREIAVHRLDQAAPARPVHCHLMFLAAGAHAGTVANERGVLTVGEHPGFVERGGIINLTEERGRIRFEINQAAAQQAGLTVSSRLLDLAIKR
jgi:hypothetical protein